MIVRIGSDTERRQWLRGEILKRASKSWWNPMTGTSDSAVVCQKNNTSMKKGHRMIFDTDGYLIAKAIEGENPAYGKGEEKRRFSSEVTVRRYRQVVKNNDKFDTARVGAPELSQHSDSRNKLADKMIRWLDQARFDVASGIIKRETGGNHSPYHRFQFGTRASAADAGEKAKSYYSSAESVYGDGGRDDITGQNPSTRFDYDELMDLQVALETGEDTDLVKYILRGGDTAQGLGENKARAPLNPYSGSDMEPMYLMVLDPFAMNVLAKSGQWKNIMSNADTRGESNRLLKGVRGMIGSLKIMEAPTFFGTTGGVNWGLQGGNLENAYSPVFSLADSAVERAGLRRFDGNGRCTGQHDSVIRITSMDSGGIDRDVRRFGSFGKKFADTLDVLNITLDSALTADERTAVQGTSTSADFTSAATKIKANANARALLESIDSDIASDTANPTVVSDIIAFNRRADERWSRGFIVGRNAMQYAWGKQPDYMFRESEDFGITSESAVEYWMGIQRTRYMSETAGVGDYDDAKVTNHDFGIINIDIRTK